MVAGDISYQHLSNFEFRLLSMGVRLCGISFIVERETAQTVS